MLKRKQGPSGKSQGAPKRRKLQGDYQKGRELARTPKAELKAFDVAEGTVPITNAGNPPGFQTLNAMINGAELYQRVGRKVYMKSLHLRGYIFVNTTSVLDCCRLVIYYDSQPNGAPPTFAALFADSNAAGASTFTSEINLFNRTRFKILKDKQFMLHSVTNTAGVLTNGFITDTMNHFAVNEFVKLKGLEAVYNGTNGGTVADINSGAVGFVIFSDVENGNYELKWGSRLRYYD